MTLLLMSQEQIDTFIATLRQVADMWEKNARVGSEMESDVLVELHRIAQRVGVV